VIVNEPTSTSLLRIGELSRRLGVSDHVLRAWERRYGLLRPVRSAGGFRLYSEDDLARVQRMQTYLAGGLSAAEAARAAISDERRPRAVPAEDLRSQPTGIAQAANALRHALDTFDEPGAHAVLDGLFSTLTIETVLRDVLMPYLYELGERWQRGDISVADEHFASNVVRGRLAGLARGWGHGHGPRAVLACAPGELHDIALLAFGIVLNRGGWRVEYFGANTPLEDLAAIAATSHPDVIVLAATVPERFTAVGDGLARLAREIPVALAGAGATREIAEASGARLLVGDPVSAAASLPLPPGRD
jgi:MerR family transcriptional regulator, light-induced transcriptional regulator